MDEDRWRLRRQRVGAGVYRRWLRWLRIAVGRGVGFESYKRKFRERLIMARGRKELLTHY